MVLVNDQIVEVDGRSLHGYTNQEAVEMLRATGNIVRYGISKHRILAWPVSYILAFLDMPYYEYRYLPVPSLRSRLILTIDIFFSKLANTGTSQQVSDQRTANKN